MTERLLNCWEIKGCGREPGDDNSVEQGPCPAATEGTFNGINGGVFGGRICWAVAGTFCGGCAQGIFAEKIESCVTCEVFKLVTTQEGEKFQMFPGDDPESTSVDTKCSAFDGI